MKLLKFIIHHADNVQNKFLVQKKIIDPRSELRESKSASLIDIFTNETAIAEINDKCYQRWHQVLQEGLVPESVRALNLLEKTGGEDINDEENVYFATMEGMDEEIKVMALLARAAILPDIVDSDNKGDDGMEQINAMMKCTAMLLFQIVLTALEEAATSHTSSEDMRPVAAYDGRIRHVMKLACVDVISRAIIESVEEFHKKNTNSDIEGGQSSNAVYDVDDYSFWNIANIASFLDRTELGNDAIFGRPDKPRAPIYLESEKMQLDVNEEKQKLEGKKPPSKSDGQLSTGGDDTLRKSPESFNPMVSARSNSEAFSALVSANSSSSSLEIQSVEIKEQEAQFSDISRWKEADFNRLISQSDTPTSLPPPLPPPPPPPAIEEDRHEPDINYSIENVEVLMDLRARRQFNAKFLATRKFELIERLVGIDIVRFLIVEEREIKQREKELAARQKKAKENGFHGDTTNLTQEEMKMIAHPDLQQQKLIEEAKAKHRESEEGRVMKPQFLSPSNVQQIVRGAKIAGAGLALGTVFAITGGLAAPALAAAIGGIAALTGAGAAHSAALLAVLATFKAGAALFGVGGGGLSAYKMKTRTAGLSDFSIRRENIEQYMYLGASDEKMRKGIEAMLPQLHTTVAVAGWVREKDIADYQLAWGIQPTCRYKKEDNNRRIRQLKRFYAIYNPPLVHLCEGFMETLQKKLRRHFSWDRCVHHNNCPCYVCFHSFSLVLMFYRIWAQLEAKYGSNPDHMIPIDSPQDNEVAFLSYEEKEMIDGVLNDAKLVNLRKRGLGTKGDIDFNENDDGIGKFVQVTKGHRKMTSSKAEAEFDLDAIENEFTMDIDLGTVSSHSSEKMSDEEGQFHDSFENEKENNDDEEIDDAERRLKDDAERRLKAQARINNLLMPTQSDTQEGSTLDQKDSTQVLTTAQDPEEDDEHDSDCTIVWDWTRLYGTSDIHTVTWESKQLSHLCHLVENLALEVSSKATSMALQYSIIGAILTAVAIPATLATATKLIDDPYQIVVLRADEAGKELANCLLQSDERRPVTLVGYSFGARVIYSCLRELAHQQELWEDSRSTKSAPGSSDKKGNKGGGEHRFEYDREPASLIADVIFIGLPRAMDKNVLTSCRRVTGGRLVNCYTRNDWFLSLMFVARGGVPYGTKPAKDVPGVESYDVTSLVESHQKYADAIPSILQHIRFSEP